MLALGLGCALPPPGPGKVWLLGCLAAGLAGSACLLRARSGAHLALLGAAVLAGSALAGCAARATILPTGRPVLLEGRLGSVERGDRGGRAVLEVARVDGVPARARTRLWWSDAAVHPWAGQRVQLRAELRADEGPDVWGQFDTGAAWRARGLSTSGRLLPGSLVPLSPPPAWSRRIAEQREAFGRWTRGQPGDADAAALVGALAAGLRSELGPGWEDRFARSGLAHVLSVSGLHVAALALVLAGLLGAVLRAFPALVRRIDPRRPAAVAALPVVWAYVVFTGTQPPAVRSALMLSLVLAGRALQRHTDGLNALALAAGLLLVVDPASVHDLSLQLSFSAVLALILLAPRLRAWVPVPLPDPARPPGWRRAGERLREAFLGVCTASAAVTLASVPLVAGAFHRVSIVGWAVNVVALPVASVLTLACAITAGAFCLSPALAALPLLVASTAARGLLALVRVGAAVPFGVLPAPSFSWPSALAFALGLLGVALGVRRAGWLVGASTVAVLGGPLLAPRPPLALTVLPVGHGDALLVSSGGAHLLVDGGGVPDGIDPGARVVVPYLRERGIRRLEAVALSHPHPDHALGLLTVLREVPDRAALAPGRHRAWSARRRRPGRRRWGAGRVARGRRRPPPGRGGGARAVASSRRPRAPDGERPEPRPPPRGRRALGAPAGRCRCRGGGTPPVPREHGGEGAAPRLADVEHPAPDLHEPRLAGGLLRRAWQPLRPPRPRGGGALAGERGPGAADRRRRGHRGHAGCERSPLEDVPRTERSARCPSPCRAHTEGAPSGG